MGSDEDLLDSVLDDVFSDGRAAGEEVPEPSLDRVNELDADRKWAMDVFWAYENAGGRMTKAKAGSFARHRLWDMATKDFDGFVRNMLSKAVPVLEKMRTGQGTDEVAVEEEKAEIANMHKLLKNAIAEAEFLNE